MILPPRVRADADVDYLGNDLFRVTVQGLIPHAHRRVFLISANSDNQAAYEGLRRFVEEMEAQTGTGVKTDGAQQRSIGTADPAADSPA